MFKIIRITLLLWVLLFVAFGAWTTRTQSTDWNDSLWIKVYPINGDGSAVSQQYIKSLSVKRFAPIEQFMLRETRRYARELDEPVRVELGRPIDEQPPALPAQGNYLSIAWWSLKMRWWTHSVSSNQDGPAPDIHVFVRYHDPQTSFVLEDSVGLQKGLVGIVNAYASKAMAGTNNVIIAHEFLHTLGATDKYDPRDGQPLYPDGYADPDRQPRHPQPKAEIMAGRIPQSARESETPTNLKQVQIGRVTATEIRLLSTD